MAYQPKQSDVLDRFMRYVQVDSQSNPDNEAETPSTPAQHDMARMLGDELRSLGCTDVEVDDHAYVTGTFAASAGAEKYPALAGKVVVKVMTAVVRTGARRRTCGVYGRGLTVRWSAPMSVHGHVKKRLSKLGRGHETTRPVAPSAPSHP